jgi:hypothetical protein
MSLVLTLIEGLALERRAVGVSEEIPSASTRDPQNKDQDGGCHKADEDAFSHRQPEPVTSLFEEDRGNDGDEQLQREVEHRGLPIEVAPGTCRESNRHEAQGIRGRGMRTSALIGGQERPARTQACAARSLAD